MNTNAVSVVQGLRLIQEINKEGSPWLRVYFESSGYAELVAILPEYMFNELTPLLEDMAKERRMFVTEGYIEDRVLDKEDIDLLIEATKEVFV